MSSLDEHLAYKNDPRMPCKYGAKCYQKNPVHQKKYKHPNGMDLKKPNTKGGVVKRKHSIDSDEESNPESKKHVNTSCEKASEAVSKEQPLPLETSQTIKVDNELLEPVQVSTSDIREIIEKCFLVQMPEDFYQFWELCESINENAPFNAFKSVGLTLVGPFDVLARRMQLGKSLQDYLLHWRYYYDPPELQTVLKGDDSSCFHIGYFRDDPGEMPIFLASSEGVKDCTLKPVGGNIFAAVNTYLDHILKTGDPFRKTSVPRLQQLVKTSADSHGLSLAISTPATRQRQKKVVARSFHRLGVVVPFDKKTELGYRSIFVEEKELRAMLEAIATALPDQLQSRMSKLQPTLTAAMIAADECDFGTALELGLDLFMFGCERLNATACRLLTMAYDLLGRGAFASIAKAHLAGRKKGASLATVA